jgi:hypothetical protein
LYFFSIVFIFKLVTYYGDALRNIRPNLRVE